MPPHIVHEDRVKPFPTEAAFEEWLAANHASAKEVWIKIYKTGSGVPTITPVQAIDVALCWGWIDGVRKPLDETSFLQRYTPRKPKSLWSQIHQDNVARLTAAGRMTPYGQRHVSRATADGRWNGSAAPIPDTTETTIPSDLRVAISANPSAFETFKRLSRADLSELTSRINSMKTPLGRAAKVTELVTLLAAGGPIAPEQAPKRTPSNPESAAPAKAEGKAAAAKRPGKAKAKPTKAKAAAAKRPAKAKAKAKPTKAAAAKRPAKAKAKPAKSKAAPAKKRPSKATRAAKKPTPPKPPRKAKAKAKNAKATASKKKKAKRTNR